MADENKIVTSLADFDMGIDNASGELTMTKRPQPLEQGQEIESQEQPQLEDRNTVIDNQFNSLNQQLQQQSNVIKQLGQFILQQQQGQTQQPTLDQEQLGEVFSDPQKGNAFIGMLTDSIKQIVKAEFGTLQPLLQQSQLQTELSWFQSQPDYTDYAVAVNQILQINPSKTIPEAYAYAKQQGWKSVPVKQTPNQPNNVQNINERRLPERNNSSNANLSVNSEPKNVKEALEMALEELGA